MRALLDELAFGALTTWLEDIDRGMDPAERDDPQDCVRLCATADGLSLIRWAKTAWDLPCATIRTGEGS
jgi:hypothetical protein